MQNLLSSFSHSFAKHGSLRNSNILGFKRVYLKTLLAGAVLTGPINGSANAEEVIDVWKENWSCGKEVTLTKNELKLLSASRVFHAEEKIPDFILGRIRDDETTMVTDSPLMLFIRNGEAWRTIAIAAGSDVSNIYVSPETGRVMIFSMWVVEGPGQEYTVTTTADGFRTISCGILPSPDTDLGTLDYMQIMGLNSEGVDKAVIRGIVIFGSSEIPKPNAWFEAKTEDGGKTWSKPQQISDPPLYEFSSGADEMKDDLIKKLQNYSK